MWAKNTHSHKTLNPYKMNKTQLTGNKCSKICNFKDSKLPNFCNKLICCHINTKIKYVEADTRLFTNTAILDTFPFCKCHATCNGVSVSFSIFIIVRPSG